MNTVNLTAKQKEVLFYLAQGLQNKEIAFHMNVSIATVKLHLLALYARLHVNNRMRALLKAQELNLIEPIAQQYDKTSAE